MVPTSWTALLLLCLAVLPGATFTFAFERQVSAYGVTLADRVLRFVAVSVAFDVLYAWPAYGAYRLWIAGRPFGGGQFVVTWTCVVVALGVPTAAGSILGGLFSTRTSRDGWSWVRRRLPARLESSLLRLALGPDPAPRAWDYVFSERPTAYLRVRRTDGTWIGGIFATDSYAGGFPHEADLYIEDAWPVDADGVFGDGPLGYALYVPAASIAHVEIVNRPGREEAS